MKKYLLVLLVGLATQVFSQGRDEQYTPPVMQQNQVQSSNGTNVNLYMSKEKHYKKMMVKGIVLASVGAVCAGGGAALLTYGINQSGTSSSSAFSVQNGAPQIVTGAALTVVGVVGVCLGTPLAIVGAVKSKKYKNQVSVLFSPTGCKVAYTF